MCHWQHVRRILQNFRPTIFNKSCHITRHVRSGVWFKISSDEQGGAFHTQDMGISVGVRLFDEHRRGHPGQANFVRVSCRKRDRLGRTQDCECFVDEFDVAEDIDTFLMTFFKMTEQTLTSSAIGGSTLSRHGGEGDTRRQRPWLETKEEPERGQQ